MVGWKRKKERERWSRAARAAVLPAATASSALRFLSPPPASSCPARASPTACSTAPPRTRPPRMRASMPRRLSSVPMGPRRRGGHPVRRNWISWRDGKWRGQQAWLAPAAWVAGPAAARRQESRRNASHGSVTINMAGEWI